MIIPDRRGDAGGNAGGDFQKEPDGYPLGRQRGRAGPQIRELGFRRIPATSSGPKISPRLTVFAKAEISRQKDSEVCAIPITEPSSPPNILHQGPRPLSPLPMTFNKGYHPQTSHSVLSKDPRASVCPAPGGSSPPARPKCVQRRSGAASRAGGGVIPSTRPLHVLPPF